MKKIILIVLGVLLVSTVALNAIAPSDFKIEREVVINHPKNFVFGYLKFLKNFSSWNPFLEKDPKAITVLKNTDGMVGAILYWSGNMEVGTGEQEIKNIVEGERIDYELRFKIPFKAVNQSYFSVEAVDANHTKVKWGMFGKNQFPMNVIGMLMGMNKMLEHDFDQGLSKLKSELEKMIATPVITL